MGHMGAAKRHTGVKKLKRGVVERLAKKIKDRTIILCHDIVQKVKLTYRPPCETGKLIK